MSMQHFLMNPDKVYSIGNETVSLAEELNRKLEEMDNLIKSIRSDKDYKSDVGSEALISAAESKYPMLLNGARTVEKFGNYAKYASNATVQTDEEIASNVAKRVGDIQ